MDDKLKNHITKIVNAVITPDKGEISSLQINSDGEVILIINIDPKNGAILEKLRLKAERKIGALRGISKVSVVLSAEKNGSVEVQKKRVLDPIIDVAAKRIILIASGKGGVGKSTISANIAVKLAQSFDVGLLDADIYGPSQPLMMGGQDYKPELNSDKKLIPMEAHGIKIMSIGFMVDKSKALVWRGPMMQKALFQMIRDVDWTNEGKPLDYLIIDMPPGTGDVQLTLAQKLKIDGAIIVSTPQDIALIDARRAVDMFNKTDVPVLGLIENMSTHTCSNCGHEEHIFGHGGASKEAAALGIPFLGEIPLSRNIRTQSDNGKPIVIAEPKSKQAQAFCDIVSNIENLA